MPELTTGARYLVSKSCPASFFPIGSSVQALSNAAAQHLRLDTDRYRSCTQGFLLNSGQVCAAASRTFVQESIADKFIEGLKAQYEGAGAAMGADPMKLDTALGPLADKSQFDRVMSFIESGKSEAELVTGGARAGDKGNFILPTIFKNPKAGAKIYEEEIFGPVLTVKTFKTEEDGIELANNTSYGLSSCVYTSSVSRALRVASALEAGTVAVNAAHTPPLQVPFGGVKQSGNGRELGTFGLKMYMEPKSILIK